MPPISCAVAEEMFRGRPFSFIEICGVQCTVLSVGFNTVITAAICVEFDADYRRFLIFTTAGAL
jgi:hypothetical protein